MCLAEVLERQSKRSGAGEVPVNVKLMHASRGGQGNGLAMAVQSTRRLDE